MKHEKEYHLGTLTGVKIIIDPIVIVTFFIVWFIFSLLAKQTNLSRKEAILGGLLAALIHWFSELGHQMGHASAARQTGYPMDTLRFMGPFSQTLFPEDEPELSPDVHIQRALGGPLASFGLSGIAWIVARLLAPLGGLIAWTGQFFFRENFFFGTLGTLAPYDIKFGNVRFVSDGLSAWRWWQKR